MQEVLPVLICGMGLLIDGKGRRAMVIVDVSAAKDGMAIFALDK